MLREGVKKSTFKGTCHLCGGGATPIPPKNTKILKDRQADPLIDGSTTKCPPRTCTFIRSFNRILNKIYSDLT